MREALDHTIEAQQELRDAEEGIALTAENLALRSQREALIELLRGFNYYRDAMLGFPPQHGRWL